MRGTMRAGRSTGVNTITGGGVPMYTEICPELGDAIAAASSAPYIQFDLILCLLLRNSNLNDDREWPAVPQMSI